MAKTTEEVKKKRPRLSGSENSARSNKEDGKLSEEAPASVKEDRASQLRSKESPLTKKVRTDGQIPGNTLETTDKSEGKSTRVATLLDSSAPRTKPKNSPGVEDLRLYVKSLGGELEDGWQVESHRRHSGGKLTRTYVSPTNERFRSRVEVAKHLGLSAANSLKKEEMHLSNEIAPLQMDVDKVQQQDVETDGQRTLISRSKKGGKSKLHEHDSTELSGQRKEHSYKLPSSQDEAVNTLNNGAVLASNEVKAIIDVQNMPAASVVTERCQDALRSIISTESFAALNNILNRGSPSGSIDSPLQMKGLPRSIDLQLIQLRLSNGVYGLDPNLFSSDVGKVWDNIIAVGKEQVALAHSLSEFSEKLYQQQIMSLFQASASKEVEGKGQITSQQGKQSIEASVLSLDDSHVLQGNPPEKATDMQASKGDAGQEKKPIQAYTSKRLSKKTTKSKKPLLFKVKVADKKIPAVCKKCGLEQGMDYIVCRTCGAGFHTQCLAIPPNTLQDGEWYCPSCAVINASSEKLALTNDGSPKGLRKTIGNAGVCEACKKEDDNILRCDGCEAAYHMNCIIPTINIVPDELWYCPKCTEDVRCPLKDVHEKDSPPDVHNCSVCIRVPKVSPLPDEHPSPVARGEPPEKSVECAAAEEVNEPASTAVSTDIELPEPSFLLGNENACKACGAECTKPKSMASCSFCSNRFHLSCLRPPLKKAPRNTWYCPSCLCRVCKIDADDEQILLCDTCDDGYHTYCLDPPLQERPKGAWFCPSCAKSDAPSSPSPKQSEVLKRKRKSTEPRRST